MRQELLDCLILSSCHSFMDNFIDWQQQSLPRLTAPGHVYQHAVCQVTSNSTRLHAGSSEWCLPKVRWLVSDMWLRSLCDFDADCLLEKSRELVPQPPQVDHAIWIVSQCSCQQRSMSVSFSESDHCGTMASPSSFQLAAVYLCQNWRGTLDEWVHH